MPVSTTWIPNEVALTHNGVRIYHVYRDDSFDDGVRQYWFGLTANVSDYEPDDDGFDVRELDTWNPETRDVLAAIRNAIDSGELKASPADQPPGDRLVDTVDRLTLDQMKAALLDIARRCLCDEDGNVNPDESVAASSAADFVDSVTYTLSLLGITEDLGDK